jgi:LuxR family transcriptional regulator, regulator of acetate metabolism
MSRIRGIDDIATMMRKATIELCDTCEFDRAMLSRVHESEIVVESAYVPADPELALRALEFGKTNRPQLNHLLIETEMVRLRKPILVADTATEPKTHAGFVTLLQTRAYVAAPIMPRDRVIGFLHADLADSDRIPDVIDRDRLWAFAEALGYTIERTILQQRLRRQASLIRSLLRSTQSALDGLSDAEIELAALGDGPVPEDTIPARRLITALDDMEESLTTRERQVLKLIVDGATNAQIAAKLVISLGTVKSHVAQVLRKLGASNRADAVSRYLQAKAASAGSENV